MTVESWIALVVALVVLGLTPGPAWAAVVATAAARGVAPAVAMALGIALGDVAFVLAAVFGLAALVELVGGLFLAVKWAGAAYLIWLGIRLWRSPGAAVPAAAVPARRRSAFVAGFVLTLGNPKVIAFYLGFLPAFLDLRVLDGGAVALLAATAFTVIAGFLSAYALAAAASRRLMSGERSARWLGRAAGTTLVGTGIAVATR